MIKVLNDDGPYACLVLERGLTQPLRRVICSYHPHPLSASCHAIMHCWPNLRLPRVYRKWSVVTSDGVGSLVLDWMEADLTAACAEQRWGAHDRGLRCCCWWRHMLLSLF